jgi:transposase-like protein
MEGLPKRKFTAEFRLQVVRLVPKGKVPQAEAARQLGSRSRRLRRG